MHRSLRCSCLQVNPVSDLTLCKRLPCLAPQTRLSGGNIITGLQPPPDMDMPMAAALL